MHVVYMLPLLIYEEMKILLGLIATRFVLLGGYIYLFGAYWRYNDFHVTIILPLGRVL